MRGMSRLLPCSHLCLPAPLPCLSLLPYPPLHVSGPNHKVGTHDLEAVFAKIGRASVMYDPHARESRGFGRVYCLLLFFSTSASPRFLPPSRHHTSRPFHPLHLPSAFHPPCLRYDIGFRCPCFVLSCSLDMHVLHN
ncbi:hypothetical protein B0H10DRAFT_2032467 [Mycena sp. CBHHK59/15]|nr:hypothetical protein B0H10DRAFT_2032467 [Mycena sp. CBHHK59/15]